VRSIDWRATARRQDVVVRTWRPERDRTLLLVVDTSRTSAGRVGDVPRLDASLDAALLLTALASRAGDRVDLLAFDRVPRAAVEGAGRTDVLRRTVDALSVLEPALVEADGRRLVGEVLRRARRRSLVVLFTSLDAAALEEGLLPHLASLTSRHTVVLAAVADPAWRRWPPAAGRPRRCTTPPPRSVRAPSGGGSPRCCGGAGSRSSTPRRSASRPPSRTPTSRSRLPAGCDLAPVRR
jgi:uncharacterized protein (DUF58 family)